MDDRVEYLRKLNTLEKMMGEAQDFIELSSLIAQADLVRTRLKKLDMETSLEECHG